MPAWSDPSGHISTRVVLAAGPCVLYTKLLNVGYVEGLGFRVQGLGFRGLYRGL